VSGESAVRLEGQAGDVSVGDVAAGNVVKISGADANKIVDLLQAQMRYNWDDDQRREIRQGQMDQTRRRERDEEALRWEMMRQRFEAIATRLDRLDHRSGQMSRMVLGVIVVVTLLALAMVAHYLGLIGVAAGAALIYLVRSR
jgi:Flp pilus assembly protein TadB